MIIKKFMKCFYISIERYHDQLGFLVFIKLTLTIENDRHRAELKHAVIINLNENND